MAIQIKPQKTVNTTVDYVNELLEKAGTGRANSDHHNDRLARMLLRAFSDEPAKDYTKDEE